MDSPERSTIRRDVASAYLAAGARIAAWVIVSAIVFRTLGAAEFALLALVRATLGLLNYLSVGLVPAMLRVMAETYRPQPALKTESLDPSLPRPLDYARPPSPDYSLRSVYAHAMTLTALAYFLGVLLVSAYAATFGHFHELTPGMRVDSVSGFVVMMGLGTILRLLSDAPGAVLQIRGRIFQDNLVLAAAEGVWVILVVSMLVGRDAQLEAVGNAYALAYLVLFVTRYWIADRQTRIRIGWHKLNWHIARQLLGYGSIVMLAQLADFLYAPADYILINRFIDPIAVAIYAPAVQIDAAILLLVTGLATALLPHAAVLHVGGEHSTLRRYYLVGTLFSAALLAGAALLAWALSPQIFRLWLGDEMTATQAILPLVLIHTVVGGSSAVGRSILLGMGKVKPFAAAALSSGVLNVILSLVFIHLGWGLRGVVIATIIAVTLRCVLWMPWYVLRTIRTAEAGSTSDQRY